MRAKGSDQNDVILWAHPETFSSFSEENAVVFIYASTDTSACVDVQFYCVSVIKFLDNLRNLKNCIIIIV